MSSLIDTIMNIEVFGFIALLVWLYFRQDPVADNDDTETGNRND